MMPIFILKLKRYDTVDWGAKYDFRNIEEWMSLNNIFSMHYYTVWIELWS